MRFIELTNKKILDDFVSTNSGDFLQSWGWGEFQISVGSKIERLGVIGDNDDLLAAVTIIKRALPFGFAYWFVPRGPVIAKSQFPISNFQTNSKSQFPNNAYDFLMNELKIRAGQEKIVFLRFEPPVVNNVPEYHFWKELVSAKNIFPTIALEPAQTRMLDLTIGVANILADMHQKTRYNVRLAEKKGVKIFIGDEKDCDDWWQILQETGGRDGFRLHSKKYYAAMMQIGFMKLYLARHDNKILAGILVSHFGQTATYVHGASSNEGRHLMAPYLLQWEAIKESLTENYQYYDFYGVDKVKWPGVTRFKEGFGGQNMAYLGTFDLVFNRGYYGLYGLLRKGVRMVHSLKK